MAIDPVIGLSREDFAMKTWKKVLIGVGAVLVLVIIVGVTVYQSRKNLVTVQTGKAQKQNLSSVVSASGEIKPKTYVNIGANAFGKIVKLHVKEGDRVKKGRCWRSWRTCSLGRCECHQGLVAGGGDRLHGRRSGPATSRADLNRAKSDADHARLDWERAQGLYKAALIAKQDYDTKKAAWEIGRGRTGAGRGEGGPSQGAEGFRAEAHLAESGELDAGLRRTAKDHRTRRPTTA